jgi:hypothetical protein
MAVTFNSGVTRILPFPDIIKMDFPGVILRFYPLVADVRKLQDYCDTYLNFVNEDHKPPVYFRPALPYVLLHLIDYPRMEQADQWLKSREIIVGIPIEWYSRDDKGKLHFRNWGMTFPFIYLDNPISIWIGREIYGLPKVQIDVVEDPTRPARHGAPHPYLSPAQNRRVLAYNLPSFSESNPGEPQHFNRNFLEVYQEPRPYPLSVTRPADLFSAWPRAVASYLSTVSAIAEGIAGVSMLWAGPRLWAGALSEIAKQARGFAGTPIGQLADSARYLRIPDVEGLETVSSMTEKSMGLAGTWLPEMFKPLTEPRAIPGGSSAASPFFANQIGLKQFPDAADPTRACYQAIVHSSATFQKANDAGLLFDPMLGDPTGGTTIRIYDIEPIVKSLGIQATREQGDNFVTVKPLFPFWWNLDVGYGSADNLCWRLNNETWSTPGQPGKPGAGDHPYLHGLSSSARMDVTFPFARPSKVTTHILPLRADHDTLVTLCNTLLDDQDPTTNFAPAAPYVLMLVVQFAHMRSGNDKQWADTEVIFAIPAYTGRKDPVLLPLIGFVNCEWNAITDREIYGRFSLQASIEACDRRRVSDLSLSRSPDPDLWFFLRSPLMADKDEDDIKKAYAIVGASRVPTARRPQGPGWRQLNNWLRQLNLSPDQPDPPSFNSVALKQFRDAQDPVNIACYRELVTVGRQFSRTTKKWIEQDFGTALQVNIREYSHVKLASTLGLERTPVSPDHPSPMPFPLQERAKARWAAELGQRSRMLMAVLETYLDEYWMLAENPIWIEGNLVAR